MRHNAQRIERIGASIVAPPMPPMASNNVGGLRLLFGLRRNAYQAFPSRCLDEPVVTLRALGRTLVLATAPDAIRHIKITQGED